MSLGDKGGETHTNSIKELCECTDFPRSPKAMEEVRTYLTGRGEAFGSHSDRHGRSPEQKENT